MREMKLHTYGQRILKHLLEKGEATPVELKEYFSPIPAFVIDFHLTRLTQDGLIEQPKGKIRVTIQAERLQDKLPEVPVHELVVYLEEDE